MLLHDYLIEVQLGTTDKKLDKLFNIALEQVFDKDYLDRIESTIQKKIKLKEKTDGNTNIVAWTQGTTIYVNQQQFYAREYESQIKYLLHEFMHVLNNSRSMLITRNFKEINALSKALWDIVLKHSKNPGVFLTSHPVSRRLLNDQEALSYLMNDKINWNFMSPEGRKLFKDTIQKSNVFNLESEFWKKRLS